jgi:hypothetical protein
MEAIYPHTTIEQARNAAVKWLENHGVVFGPYREVEIGRLGYFAGKEVGVSSTRDPYWRIRLDYDPAKGPHYNAEIGKGASREKAAFTFQGTVEMIASLAEGRKPR